MATFICVLCGVPVNRQSGRLTDDKKGWQCGDLEGCLQRQPEKELPAVLHDAAENAEVG